MIAFFCYLSHDSFSVFDGQSEEVKNFRESEEVEITEGYSLEFDILCLSRKCPADFYSVTLDILFDSSEPLYCCF